IGWLNRVGPDIAFLQMSGYDVELVALRAGGGPVSGTAARVPEGMARSHRSRGFAALPPPALR
ncbi:MAG: hypothetical protein ACRDT5_19975, partial [Mycobacterium sp.]